MNLVRATPHTLHLAYLATVLNNEELFFDNLELAEYFIGQGPTLRRVLTRQSLHYARVQLLVGQHLCLYSSTFIPPSTSCSLLGSTWGVGVHSNQSILPRLEFSLVFRILSKRLKN